MKVIKQKENVVARVARFFGFAKNTKKVISVVLLAMVSAFILIWILPQLPQKPQTLAQKHYIGVLEMWNVEGFEGGAGSRQNWLTSRAAKFEQKNQGLFVHVTTLTEAQLSDKLENGETFDLLCFSRGVASEVQNLLQPYTGSVADIGQNLLSSGEINGNVIALPIYAGVYCLFARESQLPKNSDLKTVALTASYTRKIGKKTIELSPMICGFSDYISPVSALTESGMRGKYSPNQGISQYAAYESFVANKTAVTLLGTQRDLYRLGKREEYGKIEKLAFCALEGYTDLVQYVALSASAGEKAFSASMFMQYLVSAEAQQTLVDIGMFSVADSIYTSERYVACENALQSARVPNVFAEKQSIEQQHSDAVRTLNE